MASACPDLHPSHHLVISHTRFFTSFTPDSDLAVNQQRSSCTKTRKTMSLVTNSRKLIQEMSLSSTLTHTGRLLAVRRGSEPLLHHTGTHSDPTSAGRWIYSAGLVEFTPGRSVLQKIRCFHRVSLIFGFDVSNVFLLVCYLEFCRYQTRESVRPGL